MRKKYYRIFIRKSGNKQASRRILPVPFQFFHHSVRRIKTGIIQRLFASVCPGGTAGQKQSPHLFSLHRMSCCLYRPAYLPVSPTNLNSIINHNKIVNKLLSNTYTWLIRAFILHRRIVPAMQRVSLFAHVSHV